MRAVIALIALFFVAQVVLATEFKSCLDEHFVKVDTVEVDPQVIRPSGEAAAVVTGVTSVPISRGYANVTVTKDGKQYVLRQYDLCEELMHHEHCPMDGKFEIRVPLFWGRDEIPEGNYTVKVDLHSGEHGQHHIVQVACFQFDVTVGGHEEEAANCAPCGTILTHTSGGCPSYSNGGYQGTGTGCAGEDATGLRYQCVELVNRCGGHRFTVAYARQMCENHPPEYCKVADPKEHDIYVTAAYTYGHTAIVQARNGGYVTVVEQNASCTGRGTYSMGGAECFLQLCK